MLVLCSLMQPFIMAMLKFHSIIDFLPAVHPQVDGGGGGDRADVVYRCLCLDWVLWLN